MFNFAPHFGRTTMEYNDKQVQIMVAAEELFAEKGFDGTSVRDISDKAGVNLAMISYYFGSKEKLLEVLFTYRAESSVLKMESLLQDKASTPLQKVYHLIDYYIDKFQNQTCFHKIMSREQVHNYRNAITESIKTFKRRNQALVQQLILEGQKKGEFKKNIDVPIMMATLVGTVSHLITTQHYYREMNNLEGMSDEDFNKLIKKKLSQHLKFLFKAILTHEA
ncbi:MAG: TetR family transcriptional regulator [Chitinophagaceae bacterium]